MTTRETRAAAHVVQRLTPSERADRYRRAFPDYPAVYSDKDWLLGQWCMGNDYRGFGYYGAYPPSYLRRVLSMFPEPRGRVLHLFSGSLPPGLYVRLDLRSNVSTDVRGHAELLPFQSESFDLILADPPYSDEDAARYGTCLIDRRKVFAACSRVLRPGGHLVWLDMVHPMYRKADLRLWGEIGITRSTNHRYRIATFFERQPRAAGTPPPRTESPMESGSFEFA